MVKLKFKLLIFLLNLNFRYIYGTSNSTDLFVHEDQDPVESSVIEVADNINAITESDENTESYFETTLSYDEVETSELSTTTSPLPQIIKPLEPRENDFSEVPSRKLRKAIYLKPSIGNPPTRKRKIHGPNVSLAWESKVIKQYVTDKEDDEAIFNYEHRAIIHPELKEILKKRAKNNGLRGVSKIPRRPEVVEQLKKMRKLYNKIYGSSSFNPKYRIQNSEHRKINYDVDFEHISYEEDNSFEDEEALTTTPVYETSPTEAFSDILETEEPVKNKNYENYHSSFLTVNNTDQYEGDNTKLSNIDYYKQNFQSESDEYDQHFADDDDNKHSLYVESAYSPRYVLPPTWQKDEYNKIKQYDLSSIHDKKRYFKSKTKLPNKKSRYEPAIYSSYPQIFYQPESRLPHVIRPIPVYTETDYNKTYTPIYESNFKRSINKVPRSYKMSTTRHPNLHYFDLLKEDSYNTKNEDLHNGNQDVIRFNSYDYPLFDPYSPHPFMFNYITQTPQQFQSISPPLYYVPPPMHLRYPSNGQYPKFPGVPYPSPKPYSPYSSVPSFYHSHDPYSSSYSQTPKQKQIQESYVKNQIGNLKTEDLKLKVTKRTKKSKKSQKSEDYFEKIKAEKEEFKAKSSKDKEVAGRDFPVFHDVPKTIFSCKGKIGGYYADPQARCQVFHMCHSSDQMDSFLCPNGTIFNQKILTCDHWRNVDCNNVHRYYNVNMDIYNKKKNPEKQNNNNERYNSLHDLNIIPDDNEYSNNKYNKNREIYVPEPRRVAIEPIRHNSVDRITLDSQYFRNPPNLQHPRRPISRDLSTPNLQVIQPHVVDPRKVDPFLP